MRSPLAYTPRPRPLQSASPQAAIAYLGAFAVVAFIYSNPIVLAAAAAGAAIAGIVAGARRAVAFSLAPRAAARGADGRRQRPGHRPRSAPCSPGSATCRCWVRPTSPPSRWRPGATIGLRALAVIVAASVYSACVDPDRVLRLLRPDRRPLGPHRDPGLEAGAGRRPRRRPAARGRAPARSRGGARVGRGAFARRLLAGSLDRSVDVAATLELRGYGLSARPAGGVAAQPLRPPLLAHRRGSAGRRCDGVQAGRRRRL